MRLDFVGQLKLFDAGVRNIIFFVEKAGGTHWRPERRLHLERADRLPEEPMIGNVKLLPTDEQRNLTHRTFFPEDAVAKTFSAATLPLETICYISVGIVAHADEKRAKGEFELADLVSETRDATHPKKFVEGKHLGRWVPISHRWLEWGTIRAPELFRRPTFLKLYEIPEKLISVDMSAGIDRLKVTYDDQHLFHNHSAWSFVPWHHLSGVKNTSIKKTARYPSETPKREDLPNRLDLENQSRRFSAKFLAAVMNSSFAYDFLKANRRSNIHLFPDDWKQLPIPDVTPEQQAPIVALVDKILTAKRAKPDADVATLEAEADLLVTALYGLTPKEIKIVEGTTQETSQPALQPTAKTENWRATSLKRPLHARQHLGDRYQPSLVAELLAQAGLPVSFEVFRRAYWFLTQPDRLSAWARGALPQFGAKEWRSGFNENLPARSFFTHLKAMIQQGQVKLRMLDGEICLVEAASQPAGIAHVVCDARLAILAAVARPVPDVVPALSVAEQKELTSLINVP